MDTPTNYFSKMNPERQFELIHALGESAAPGPTRWWCSRCNRKYFNAEPPTGTRCDFELTRLSNKKIKKALAAAGNVHSRVEFDSLLVLQNYYMTYYDLFDRYICQNTTFVNKEDPIENHHRDIHMGVYTDEVNMITEILSKNVSMNDINTAPLQKRMRGGCESDDEDQSQVFKRPRMPTDE